MALTTDPVADNYLLQILDVSVCQHLELGFALAVIPSP
jgi:hypothetical protein